MKLKSFCSTLTLFGCLVVGAPQAQSAPDNTTWEKKWYPVQDGQENKIYVRFGTDNRNGKRYRQWSNGYDHWVKFTGYIIYQGAGPNQPNPNRTFTDKDYIPLDGGQKSDPGTHITMQNAPLLDIRAEIVDQ